MGKIRYLIFIISLSINLLADTTKVYFYTTESNISDFKSLKVNFDKYLKDFGEYEFQAFNSKKIFESYLANPNIIVALSSRHFKQISKNYNLEAKLIAIRKNTITDTEVIVGRKKSKFKGTLTSAFSKGYTKKFISKFIISKNLDILSVPKEIDALMSVGFGMSTFALVSKDSFELLKRVNPYISKQMQIYKESKPIYRMIIASNLEKSFSKKIINIFRKMKEKDIGKKILSMLRVDDIVILSKKDLDLLRGEE